MTRIKNLDPLLGEFEMNKDRAQRRDPMRDQLAHQAAKLMAEGGITDYAFAKRKAAKQLGAEDTQHLPSNAEIDTALRSHRALYESDSHPFIMRELRQQALEIMRLFKPFNPYLTGSVLNGTAGEQSDINLIIYSDDEKSVMMFLLEHNLPFESGEWRARLLGEEKSVPCFMLQTENDVPISLAVLPENARHSSSRKRETYADMAAVEALLAGE